MSLTPGPWQPSTWEDALSADDVFPVYVRMPRVMRDADTGEPTRDEQADSGLAAAAPELHDALLVLVHFLSEATAMTAETPDEEVLLRSPGRHHTVLLKAGDLRQAERVLNRAQGVAFPDGGLARPPE